MSSVMPRGCFRQSICIQALVEGGTAHRPSLELSQVADKCLVFLCSELHTLAALNSVPLNSVPEPESGGSVAMAQIKLDSFFWDSAARWQYLLTATQSVSAISLFIL
jgi:hypothetical protein